jgi:hypothetical protein
MSILIVLLVTMLVATGATTPPTERGNVYNFALLLTQQLSPIVPKLTLAMHILRVQHVLERIAFIVKELLLPLDIPLEPIAPVKQFAVECPVVVNIPRVLPTTTAAIVSALRNRNVPPTPTASPAHPNLTQPSHAIGVTTAYLGTAV